jgi:hypothetical protein
MKLIVIVCFALSLFAGVSNAQEIKPRFLEKKNQSCYEYAPLISFSYNYAHKFNPNLTLGMGVQAGYGLRFMLTNPWINYNFDNGNFRVRVRDAVDGFFLDLIKVQMFYRFSPTHHVFFDIGPYALVSYTEMDSGTSIGIECSAFYTTGNFHIGTRLLFGRQTFDSSRDKPIGLFSVPLVLGANF